MGGLVQPGTPARTPRLRPTSRVRGRPHRHLTPRGPANPGPRHPLGTRPGVLHCPPIPPIIGPPMPPIIPPPGAAPAGAAPPRAAAAPGATVSAVTAGPSGEAPAPPPPAPPPPAPAPPPPARSEEHTSELQSRENLVCRLLLEKKKQQEDERDRYIIQEASPC